MAVTATSPNSVSESTNLCRTAPDRAISDHGDLHVLCEVYDALNQSFAEEGTHRPSLLPRDEDLRDSVESGEARHCFSDIIPLNDSCFDLKSTRKVQMPLTLSRSSDDEASIPWRSRYASSWRSSDLLRPLDADSLNS